MASTKKRDQLRALMEGIDIAMFTTYGEDGYPVSRPLSTQEAEFDGKVLWFFVRRDTPKVREIARHPKVNVAYASKDRNVYLSVAGSADLVTDRRNVRRFWNDALKAYFPGGPEDPEVVLIRVTVHSVQYWEGPSTGVGKLIDFVIARVTHVDAPLGENRLLRLEEAPPRHRRAARRKAMSAGAKRGSGGSRRGESTRAAKSATKQRATAKRATSKRAPSKRAAPKRTASKRAPSKRAASKRPASKRTPAKKAATRRAAGRATGTSARRATKKSAARR